MISSSKDAIFRQIVRHFTLKMRYCDMFTCARRCQSLGETPTDIPEITWRSIRSEKSK